MTEPRFFIKRGQLHCSVPWETITGGRYVAESIFSALVSDFGPRVTLKVLHQCFRWPYLLALPSLEVGTKARLERLHQIVCDLADVIPSKGVYPLHDESGLPIEPIKLGGDFVPAPDYPGMKPGGLAETAYRMAADASVYAGYIPPPRKGAA